MNCWIDYLRHTIHGESSFSNAATMAISLYSAEARADRYEYSRTGKPVPDMDEVIVKLRSFGYDTTHIGINDHGEEWDSRFVFLIGEKQFASVYLRRESGNLSVSVYSLDKEKFDQSRAYLDKHLVQITDPGRVFMLTTAGPELHFESIGIGGLPLERSNYDSSVLAGYDHVIEELCNPSPCGRLVILSGQPGTGKTHLIRGMLNTELANFAFLPPQMVPSIGGPGIIKAIKNFQSNAKTKRPLVLILEDADEALVPRGADNMASITSVLNASEGLLGQLLDVRLIATTNAKNTDLDAAIRRPGRMCCHIQVGKLTNEHCDAILRRLVPDRAGTTMVPGTLADVYREARRLGWSPDGKSVKPLDSKDSDRKIGFGNG